MKTYFILVLLSILLIKFSFCQDSDTIIGKIVEIPNPCYTDPCLPGMIYAIQTDTAEVILSINGEWNWTDNLLIVNNDTLQIDDSLILVGQVSVRYENNYDSYYEIEVVANIPVITSMMNRSSSHGIYIYPNPTDAILNITSHMFVKSVIVYNINGRKVFSSKNVNQTPNITKLLITSKGLFLVQIEMSNNYIFTQKILVN